MLAMRDCNDPSLFERISLALIPVGCAFMDAVRKSRRPGAAWVALALVALTTVNVMRETDWPRSSWWEKGSTGQLAFIGLTVFVSAGTFLMAVGYRRLLRRERSSAVLREAAESFADIVTQKTGLPAADFGVNIWLVRGMLGFRRLTRAATLVVQKRSVTPITWTKGKGIIGQAWARGVPRFADLDAIWTSTPTARHWCELDRERRFRLSWKELNETRRYHAVLAVPLRQHRWARHPVKGVVAIDLLVPGRAAELEALADLPAFDAIIRVCEASFTDD